MIPTSMISTVFSNQNDSVIILFCYNNVNYQTPWHLADMYNAGFDYNHLISFNSSSLLSFSISRNLLCSHFSLISAGGCSLFLPCWTKKSEKIVADSTTGQRISFYMASSGSWHYHHALERCLDHLLLQTVCLCDAYSGFAQFVGNTLAKFLKFIRSTH